MKYAHYVSFWFVINSWEWNNIIYSPIYLYVSWFLLWHWEKQTVALVPVK